jgi:hypothetical protein
MLWANQDFTLAEYVVTAILGIGTVTAVTMQIVSPMLNWMKNTALITGSNPLWMKELKQTANRRKAMKLSERAMLTSVRIGGWSGKAIDRDVTEEVAESHNAESKDSGVYNKQLLSKKALRPVHSKISLIRQTHRTLTLPWNDDARILAASGYLHYTKCMRDGRLAVEEAAKALAKQMPEWVTEAKQRLGSMFDASEYPSADTILKRFYVDVEIAPIPEAGDFRTKLSEATVKAVTKDIEKRSAERVKRAVNDVFERIVDVTTKMADKLHKYEGGQGQEGTFRDSLVYNAQELADLLPSLNITGDKRLDDLAVQMKKDLTVHSPEILRSDAKARKQTVINAEKLAKKVKSFLA